MRRALTMFFALAVLATGLSFAARPAVAASGYGYGNGYGHDRGRYDDSCRCYRGQELGYWERPSDRRRWSRHHHRRYRQPPVHYYPGYGYYPDTGHGRYDRGYRGYYDYGHGRRDYGYDRDDGRSAWCARTYRSYDWRTGTYMTYDGRRVHCG